MSVTKTTAPPTKKVERIRAKWPSRPANNENTYYKSYPGTTESESWGNDDSIGGVVWKQIGSEDPFPSG